MFKRSSSRGNNSTHVVFKDFRYFHPGASWEVHIANKILEGPGIIEIRAPSGTGKSMVLGFVSGVDQSEYGGSLTVLGNEWRDIARRLGRDRLLGRHRRSIALIPAESTLVGTRTVLETLDRDLKGARVGKRERKQRIEEVLNLLDIADKSDQLLSTLSAGESQRVRIAVALARNARLIIADEPIAHLDATLANRVINALLEQSKHALVLVVHHLPPGAPDLLKGSRKDLVLLAQYRRDRLAQPLVVNKSHNGLRANTFLMTVLMLLVLAAALFMWRQSQSSDMQTGRVVSREASAVAFSDDVPSTSGDGRIAITDPTSTRSPAPTTAEEPIVTEVPLATEVRPATDVPLDEPTMTPIVFMPAEATEADTGADSALPTSPSIQPIGPEGVDSSVTTQIADSLPDTSTTPTFADVPLAAEASTTDLLSVLPSQSEIPDGLVLRDRRTRPLDEVVSKYASPALANQNFQAWGWKENAVCSFGLADGVDAQDGVLNGVYVSIHEFDSSESAHGALDFSLTEQQMGQPLDEVDVGQFGDYTRGLFGLLDYGYETTVLVQQGNLLIRVSAAELNGDPTSKAQEIVSGLLARLGNRPSRYGTTGNEADRSSSTGPFKAMGSGIAPLRSTSMSFRRVSTDAVSPD